MTGATKEVAACRAKNFLLGFCRCEKRPCTVIVQRALFALR